MWSLITNKNAHFLYFYFHLKTHLYALAAMSYLLECRPTHQRVSGSIPSQGMYLDCRFHPWPLWGWVQEVTD